MSFFKNYITSGVQNYLAPLLNSANQTREQAFMKHWEHVQNFYRTDKDEEDVGRTNVVYHLGCMVTYLKKEEDEEDKSGEEKRSSAGPCLEMLLEKRMLETVAAWGQADKPKGMRIASIQVLTQLIRQTKRPLLAENSVRAPFSCLIRAGSTADKNSAQSSISTPLGAALLGLTLAALEHIQTHPPILSVFFHNSPTPTSKSTSTPPNTTPKFELVNVVIPYLTHTPPLGNISHSCLLILTKIARNDQNDQSFIQFLCEQSPIIKEIVHAFALSYCQVPSTLETIPDWSTLPNPAWDSFESLLPPIETHASNSKSRQGGSSQANRSQSNRNRDQSQHSQHSQPQPQPQSQSQSQSQSQNQTNQSHPPNHSLTSRSKEDLVELQPPKQRKSLQQPPLNKFLSESLDTFLEFSQFFDEFFTQSHPLIKEQLLKEFTETLLAPIFIEAIVQRSEKGALASTIYLSEMIKVIKDPLLLEQIFKFLLGGETEVPEKKPVEPSDEGGDNDNQEAESSQNKKKTTLTGEQVREILLSRLNSVSEQLSLVTMSLFDSILSTYSEYAFRALILRNVDGGKFLPSPELIHQYSQPPTIHQLEETVDVLLSLIPTEDEEDYFEQQESKLDQSTQKDQGFVELKEVMPTSNDEDEYFLAAEDAQQECLNLYKNWKNQNSGEHQIIDSKDYYHGLFFSIIFQQLQSFLTLSIDKVLILTSMISKMAQLPNVYLHHFLFSPHLADSVIKPSLLSLLSQLSKDAQTKARRFPLFHQMFSNLRLSGFDRDQTNQFLDEKMKIDEETWQFLLNYKCLQEFCKELSAIALVKSHSSLMDFSEYALEDESSGE